MISFNALRLRFRLVASDFPGMICILDGDRSGAVELETLIAAKYTKNRQRLLEDANLSLEVLRFQMRLAKDLQCLKVESYAFAAKSIDEIGRLVGGWLRSRGEEKA